MFNPGTHEQIKYPVLEQVFDPYEVYTAGFVQVKGTCSCVHGISVRFCSQVVWKQAIGIISIAAAITDNGSTVINLPFH